MKELLIKLKELREKQQSYSDQLGALQATFDLENKSLIDAYAQTRMETDALETLIRERAVLLYDGVNKKLDGGVGIRVLKSITYDDAAALAWAKEHNLCLKLDNKEFEKLAKTQQLGFVKIEDRITATIPTVIE